MNQEIENRLVVFQQQLRTRDIVYMVRRFTTFGIPFVVTADQYFDLKSQIADRFEIHPSEIVMVGSAKLGFSIKPKKRYQYFGEESDIDMAIISPNLFETIWLKVLEYYEARDFWYYERKSKFQEYLFQGWIRPDMLPPSDLFPIRKDWWSFFQGLSSLMGYKVAGGLYKSWHHFELYQSRAVRLCKDTLENEQ